jgi:hypothetical protein
MRPPSKRFTLLLVAGSSLAVSAWAYFRERTDEELEREGNAIIEQLDAYKAAHGVYPESLEAASIVSRCNWYGGFRYSVCRDQSACELLIGNYSDDLFVLGWTSAQRKWWSDH